MKAYPLFRISLVVIALVTILFPIAIWGAGQSLRQMFNSPVLWIPVGNETRQSFFQFTEDFHTQDILIISWPGCTLDDERLDRFQAAIREADQGHAATNADAFFEHVVTGRSAAGDLQKPPLSLSEREATRRLRGSLAGPDGTSCAVAVLTLRGVVERESAIAMLADVLQSQVGLSADEYRLGGTPAIGLAIDEESVRAVSQLSIPSAVVIILLCCWFLRSWRLIILVLGIAFFGERLALSLVYFTGSNMNAVLVVMSPLVFVLGASAGVHLANYYREESDLRIGPGAARRMLQIGWKPCLLSAATTAIGLLSLLVSDITAVRQFAQVTAICVVLTTGVMLLSLAGVLERWPIVRAPRNSRGDVVDRWLAALSNFVMRHSSSVVVVCLVFLVMAGWGLRRMQTQVEVFQLLTPTSSIVQDHRWLEQHVAPLVPVEVILRFDNDSGLSLLDRLALVRAVQAELADTKPARGTMSALTFLPPANESPGFEATIRRSLLKKRFEIVKTRLIDLGYLYETASEQAWRVSARVPAFEELDYTTFLSILDARVRSVLDRLASPEAVRFHATGVMPVVASAQQMLLRDLVGSLLAAFLVISATIVVGLRSVRLGLVAMLPNIFPLVILFGAMGWLDQPLDIGAFMTASVALGIAVDDTVHFVTFCRREADRGLSGRGAVESAIRHCGRAITHTTVICGVGLLVFSLSHFVPTQRFAWMMFLLLVSALVADLLLLPALLAGPLRGALGNRNN